MEAVKSEKNILNIIKYGAIIPFIIFSILTTYFLIEQKNNELTQEISLLKSKYLQENKEKVKNEVYRVVDSINHEIETADEKLKLLLKEKVYEAHNIATNLYNIETHNGDDKEEIIRTIKNALGGMIYNQGRGYVFLDDANGTKLLQPLNKELEGKNLLEFEDAKGYKFVKKIVETIKNKSEAYDTYYWYKSKDDPNAYEKMSFYKYFEPLDIAIGTGEYLVDFENELKNILLERINKIRFGKNGYIFVFDKEGTYLAHFKEENIGKNGFKVKDINGKYFIKDIVNFAKLNDEGFLSYHSTTKPSGVNNGREKISFVKYFDKWQWTIGTGFYLEELNNEIKYKEELLIKKHAEIINRTIFLSITITIVLLLISFYFSRIIAHKFNIYKKEIKKEIENSVEKEKLLVQQSKMATMGEMIGNISHQWRQPLSTISTAATGSKIQKELGSLSDKEFYLAMDAINDSAQYLSQTIEDFRNFFQPSKIKTTFEIKKLFEKTSKLLSSQFSNHNIKIVENIDDIKIRGYENELLQVIINILKNAKDEFTKIDDNKIKLIFIDAQINENKIEIKIKDNAGGIEEKILPTIFDAYVTTKSKEEGTGIGLYMSKQIIEKMDGSITASNVEYEYKKEIYKGAQFLITFNVEDNKILEDI